MKNGSIQGNGSFTQIKEEMMSYLQAYSSKKSDDKEQSINFDQLQLFMDQKQKQIKDLQNFLVSEFQNIQRFKEMKKKIIALLSKDIMQLFTQIKTNFILLRETNCKIFKTINQQWGKILMNALNQKNMKIASLQNQLIQQRKNQIQGKSEEIKQKKGKQISIEILRDLEQQKFKQRHNQTTLNKKQDKMEFRFDKSPHRFRVMNKAQSQLALSSARDKPLKGRGQLTKSALYIGQNSNFTQTQKNIFKNQELRKSDIMNREGYQNFSPLKASQIYMYKNYNERNQHTGTQKKYIKQKIEQLKNKGCEPKFEKQEKNRLISYQVRRF